MNLSDAKLDLSAYWMPFTSNKDFKASPRLLRSAKGMYYESVEGRQILDGTAGLWCVNAGHCVPGIVDAIRQVVGELDYAPSFQMGHPAAFELASSLIEFSNHRFDKVFYTNSGSESVDTALKMALAYHRVRGDASRTRLIGRERGYHGVGFGGISVGGIVSNRKYFGPMLSGVDHLPHTHDLKRNAFTRGQPAFGAELADELERIVALHDASTIAAVIVEPVAGSTGVLVPPKGYLERLRAICDRHGILLIFDEVITGYGRLGTPFATDYFGVRPDIIATAKGLTNGAVPMGAVLVQDHIYQAFMSGSHAPPGGIELFHGYTYSGHPLACAAALATLAEYRNGGLLQNARALAPYWEEALYRLQEEPHVIDLRNLGLVAGIELQPRPNAPGARASEVFRRAFDAGLMVRYTGETIALSPPLIIEKAQIDQIFATLGEILRSLS
jgi:beta-alanine--pyruvate transaminase